MGGIRSLFGKSSVAPYILEHHISLRGELKTFLISELVDFIAFAQGSHIDHDLDPQPMVYCHDLAGLIIYVARARDTNEVEVLKLIGLDRGQGHTQLTLQPHTAEDLLSKQLGEKAKRRRRSEGVTVKEKSVFGVNSLIILATSPVKSENAANLSIFLAKTQLKEVCFKFCGDLKVFNEITGIQTATSTYPCYACEGKRDPKTGAWVDLPAPLRTYNSNMARHNDWLQNGGGFLGGEAGLKLSKHHCNVTEAPLLGNNEPDKPLLLILVPGGLHLKLGLVNDTLSLLGKLWSGLEDWLRRRSILYVPYHGLMLEGNECSKVLKDVDSLERELPPHLQVFASYLRSFSAVMSSTFGMEPKPSWQQDIELMRSEFLKVQEQFNLRETPKLHIIFEHIPDFVRLEIRHSFEKF